MQHSDQEPAEQFSLEEIQLFQTFENQVFAGVDYYVWLHIESGQSAPAVRFLLAVELRFESGENLLICSGEDSTAIRIISKEKLMEMAAGLYRIHNSPVIQRLTRDGQPLWQGCLGNRLNAIQLSKNTEGYYLNDAILLNFDSGQRMIALNPQGEGLIISIMD